MSGSNQPRLSVVINESELNIRDTNSDDEQYGEAYDAQSVTQSINEELDEKEQPREVVAPAEQKNSVSFEVRTPSGKKYMLHDVNLETTVLEVKEMINKLDDSYSVNIIKLIKTGKALETDQQTIREAGIKDGTVLHMVKKLTGIVNDNTPSNVGVNLQTTAAQDRGFITIRIPPNARPGTKLILTPPGRSDRLYVTVPPGYRPGDELRVRLPPERQPERSPSELELPPPRQPINPIQNEVTSPVPRPKRPEEPAGSLMKVLCPATAIPGTDILIDVPGKGRMKVKVPNTVRPGEYFYFRVL